MIGQDCLFKMPLERRAYKKISEAISNSSSYYQLNINYDSDSEHLKLQLEPFVISKYPENQNLPQSVPVYESSIKERKLPESEIISDYCNLNMGMWDNRDKHKNTIVNCRRCGKCKFPNLKKSDRERITSRSEANTILKATEYKKRSNSCSRKETKKNEIIKHRTRNIRCNSRRRNNFTSNSDGSRKDSLNPKQTSDNEMVPVKQTKAENEINVIVNNEINLETGVKRSHKNVSGKKYLTGKIREKHNRYTKVDRCSVSSCSSRNISTQEIVQDSKSSTLQTVWKRSSATRKAIDEDFIKNVIPKDILEANKIRGTFKSRENDKEIYFVLLSPDEDKKTRRRVSVEKAREEEEKVISSHNCRHNVDTSESMKASPEEPARGSSEEIHCSHKNNSFHRKHLHNTFTGEDRSNKNCNAEKFRNDEISVSTPNEDKSAIIKNKNDSIKRSKSVIVENTSKTHKENGWKIFSTEVSYSTPIFTNYVSPFGWSICDMFPQISRKIISQQRERQPTQGHYTKVSGRNTNNLQQTVFSVLEVLPNTCKWKGRGDMMSCIHEGGRRNSEEFVTYKFNKQNCSVQTKTTSVEDQASQSLPYNDNSLTKTYQKDVATWTEIQQKSSSENEFNETTSSLEKITEESRSHYSTETERVEEEEQPFKQINVEVETEPSVVFRDAETQTEETQKSSKIDEDSFERSFDVGHHMSCQASLAVDSKHGKDESEVVGVKSDWLKFEENCSTEKPDLKIISKRSFHSFLGASYVCFFKKTSLFASTGKSSKFFFHNNSLGLKFQKPKTLCLHAKQKSVSFQNKRLHRIPLKITFKRYESLKSVAIINVFICSKCKANYFGRRSYQAMKRNLKRHNRKKVLLYTTNSNRKVVKRKLLMNSQSEIPVKKIRTRAEINKELLILDEQNKFIFDTSPMSAVNHKQEFSKTYYETNQINFDTEPNNTNNTTKFLNLILRELELENAKRQLKELTKLEISGTPLKKRTITSTSFRKLKRSFSESNLLERITNNSRSFVTVARALKAPDDDLCSRDSLEIKTSTSNITTENVPPYLQKFFVYNNQIVTAANLSTNLQTDMKTIATNTLIPKESGYDTGSQTSSNGFFKRGRSILNFFKTSKVNIHLTSKLKSSDSTCSSNNDVSLSQNSRFPTYWCQIGQKNKKTNKSKKLDKPVSTMTSWAEITKNSSPRSEKKTFTEKIFGKLKCKPKTVSKGTIASDLKTEKGVDVSIETEKSEGDYCCDNLEVACDSVEEDYDCPRDVIDSIKFFKKNVSDCKEYAQKVRLTSELQNNGLIKSNGEYREIPLDFLLGRKIERKKPPKVQRDVKTSELSLKLSFEDSENPKKIKFVTYLATNNQQTPENFPFKVTSGNSSTNNPTNNLQTSSGQSPSKHVVKSNFQEPTAIKANPETSDFVKESKLQLASSYTVSGQKIPKDVDKIFEFEKREKIFGQAHRRPIDKPPDQEMSSREVHLLPSFASERSASRNVKQTNFTEAKTATKYSNAEVTEASGRTIAKNVSKRFALEKRDKIFGEVNKQQDQEMSSRDVHLLPSFASEQSASNGIKETNVTESKTVSKRSALKKRDKTFGQVNKPPDQKLSSSEVHLLPSFASEQSASSNIKETNFTEAKVNDKVLKASGQTIPTNVSKSFVLENRDKTFEKVDKPSDQERHLLATLSKSKSKQITNNQYSNQQIDLKSYADDDDVVLRLDEDNFTIIEECKTLTEKVSKTSDDNEQLQPVQKNFNVSEASKSYIHYFNGEDASHKTNRIHKKGSDKSQPRKENFADIRLQKRPVRPIREVSKQLEDNYFMSKEHINVPTLSTDINLHVVRSEKPPLRKSKKMLFEEGNFVTQQTLRLQPVKAQVKEDRYNSDYAETIEPDSFESDVDSAFYSKSIKKQLEDEENTADFTESLHSAGTEDDHQSTKEEFKKHLTNHNDRELFKKEDDTALRQSNDDKFFHDQIKFSKFTSLQHIIKPNRTFVTMTGRVLQEGASRQEDFFDSCFVLDEMLKAHLNQSYHMVDCKNPNKVQPNEVGKCFRRGFRPDNMALSGDPCASISDMEKEIRISGDAMNRESYIGFSERETPLEFLLGLGFSVDEASSAIKDEDVKNRLYAAITEARVWVNKINTTQGTLLYLVSYKTKPKTMRYFLQLVEAIINLRIVNAVKLDGFLRLLEKIEDGNLTMITILGMDKLEDEQDEEKIVKKQLRQLFYDVYTIAKNEAIEKGIPLTRNAIILLRILAAKYRAGLLPHLELIAKYIGQNLLVNEVQLEAAMIYLSRLDTAQVKLNDFEEYCAIRCPDEDTKKYIRKESTKKKREVSSISSID